MRNLITPQEVVDLAFAENSNMMADSISDTAIRIAEIKYIRPAFGVMYPLLADKYADFTNDYVKPALAYFVKCEIVSSIAIDMSNSGVAVANPQYQSAATDKQRQRLYDSEMSKAKTLLDFALEYIATHSESFPDFSGEAPKKHHRIGGLLLGGGTSRSQSASVAGEAFKAEFDKYIKEMGEISEEVSDLVESANEVAVKADAAVKAAEKAAEDTTIAITNAEDATKKATTAAGIANVATNEASKATTNANEAAQRANEEVQKIKEKADTDGTYPNMTVGKANGVVGINQVQEALTLTTKANGNIVIGNLAGQSKEFMPATPSGDPMHYFYESLGATWQPTTRYWKMYTLTDVTNEQMRASAARGRLVIGEKRSLAGSYRNLNAIRFNIARGGTTMVYLDSVYGEYFAEANSVIEVINITNYKNIIGQWDGSGATFASLQNSFYKCTKLKDILGVIILISSTVNTTNAFTGCTALEDLLIKGLGANLSFADSPLLNKESLRYMINNCASNASFTITLHPDVYEKCQEFGEWFDEINDALTGAKDDKDATVILASA